jgi:DNA-binding transcriptional ArsR family regulator
MQKDRLIGWRLLYFDNSSYIELTNQRSRIMLALEEAAQGFAAAGSEPRLMVLLTLVKAGGGGLSVGEVQDRVGIPASTLAHHLKFLAAAGLVEQEKLGRTILNRAAFDRVQALAEFLTHECCSQPGQADTLRNMPLSA